jgi:hypothetical protein
MSISRFASVVLRSGKEVVALYAAAAICVLLIVIDLFYDLHENQATIAISGGLILSFLAVLLYYEIDRNHNSEDARKLQKSGIVSFHKELKGGVLNDIMSVPGFKRILNTWIYNLPDLTSCLKEALQHKQTQVEISVLAPSSKFVALRGEELALTEDQVREHINSSKNALAFFLHNLEPEQRARVRVFEFDAMPRALYHTNDDEGYVAFFWPRTMGVDGPQFLIRGKSEPFPAMIWRYYEHLASTRRDVTEELLESLPSLHAGSG